MKTNNKVLKVFYENEQGNFGDILNVDIFKHMGFDIEYASKRKSEIVAIGSLLDLYLCDKKEYLKRFRYRFYKPAIVWGAGFIKDEEPDKVVLRKLNVHAVRGYNTLNRLKLLNDVKFDKNLAIGDPGLLTSYFFNTDKIKKKYALGIISHYVDENHESSKNINVKNSTRINVVQNPIEFVKQVAECECIVSSAMHGLICADSLGIPNMRIIQSNDIIGGDYKFNDYYSAFDIKNHKFINLNNQSINENDLQEIYDNYTISREKVKNIQKALLEAFPYESNITVTEVSN